MKIIDLSKTIEYNKKEPHFLQTKVKSKSRKKARLLVRLGGLSKKLFPHQFQGWADESISMGTHSSTHIDAPWHYGEYTGDKPAKTIDQLPLEWCFAPGIVIDVSHKKNFEYITVNDLKENLKKNNLTVKAGNIVLIRTDRDKTVKPNEVLEKGTGMSAEATEWLIEQGVRVMGIDQWGWDMPLKRQIYEAKKNKQNNVFWQAHLVGLKKEYFHMEQLTNLQMLPPSGFKISVFPLKIKNASAAPARVVAIFE